MNKKLISMASSRSGTYCKTGEGTASLWMFRSAARSLKAALLLACVCFFTVSTASAEFSPVPYYDDFAYTDTTALDGTNGWSIFTTGPGYGILPDQYHGWAGYAGIAAIASNSTARLTGVELLNNFGDYTGEPGTGWPDTTGKFDKPSVATVRFMLDLSEATAPTNAMQTISRMGNIFWPTPRWHYENRGTYYTMMPVVRAFVRTNGLVTAYNGNVMSNLTHTPITNSAAITLTLNYETFKWSLWVDDELAADDFGLYKPYRGTSTASYDHMKHDGWHKEYDGLKQIGFIDNTPNGTTVIDRLRVFEGTPSSKALPMIENFETRIVDGTNITIVPGDVNGQNNLFASDAVVSIDAQNDSVSSLGTQGAQINAGGEIFQLFLDKQTNVWSDLWLSPIASAGGSGTATVDVGGGHAVFYVNATGGVYVYNGAVATNVATAATNAFTRFTVEQDYTADTWSFYVGGSIVQSNLAFKSAGISDSYEEFRVSSSGDAVFKLDDIVIGTSSPYNYPTVTFETDAVNVATGVTEVTVTASLSWAYGQSITVQYGLMQDGTAMQIYDYSAADGSLTFLPGETEKTFSFTISHDNFAYAEHDDTLVFAMTNVINATTGAYDQITYTIATDPAHYKIIPFTETFEYRSLGSLDGQRGWEATYVDVQSNDVYAGTQAATSERLGASMSHSFTNEAMSVSVQWRAKPVLAHNEPTPPAGSTYAFYVSSNGYIVAFNGASSTNLGNVVTLNADSWAHFQVNADYNTKKWTLLVNDTTVLTDFDFYTNSAASYSGFEVHGQFSIDDIVIGYGPPATPTNLVATASDGVIALSWSEAQGATTYRVKRSTSQGGPYTLITSLSDTQYTDSSVLNDITYYYVVSAWNAMGEGNNSAEVQATPRARVTGLTAAGGISKIILDWNAYTGATNYYIKRANSSGGPYTTIASTNVNSYTDDSAQNGKTYYYVVYAETPTYNSLDSAEVSQHPALRTIFYDSFEEPDVTGRANSLIPNWAGYYSGNDSSTDRVGLWDENMDPATMITPYGEQAAFIWHDRYIVTTNIQETLEEAAYYKLSFNVAAESGLGDIYYNVALMAGETVLSEVTASWEIQLYDFGDRSDVVEFTCPAGHADIGQPLKIRVRYFSGDWHYVLGVDNVRLETSIDPPPVMPTPLTFASGPSAVSKSAITMTAEAVTNGVGPILYRFENVTTGESSGWSDALTWVNVGLTAGTEYGYRVRARDVYGNQNTWSAISYAETTGANVMTNSAGADSWNNTNNWSYGHVPVGDESARIASSIAAVVGSAPPTYSGNLQLLAGSSVEFASAAAAGVLPSSSYQIQLNTGSSLRAFTSVDIAADIVMLGDAEVLGASSGNSVTFSGSISGSGTLTLAGDNGNYFHINAANTMSGGLATRNVANAGHRVYANVNNAFGSGDVTINAYASLLIGGGLGNTISNTATLYLNGTNDPSAAAKVVLNSSETVYQLYVDGAVQPRGTHGAIGSGADYENARFSGTGLLTVTVGDDEIYSLSVRDVSESSAVLEASLDVPFTSRVARAYWSTNNNANGAAWLADTDAASSVLGTYSEKVGQSLLKGLISLSANTTYYYAFSASNTADVIWSTNETFSTVGPPVLSNPGASATGDATATLAGVLTAGSRAEVTFAWGIADAGTNSVSDWDNSVFLSGLIDENVTFSTSLSSLTYGQKYYYRVFGENVIGTGWSGAQSFLSTVPRSGSNVLVSVTGTQATNVAQTTATLKGTLDAPRSIFNVSAYWSTNNNADSSAWESDGTAQIIEIGNYTNSSGIALSVGVTGLVQDTTYYYTLSVTNSATNMWAATNVTFTTKGAPVADSSAGASNVVGSVVTLQGELADGYSADAYFVWDTQDKGTSGTNAWTNIVSAGSVTEGYVFGSTVTGFIYGVQYTYRLYVTNDYGEDWSTSQTFNALAPTSPDAAASGGSWTNIYTDGDGKLWYAHGFASNGTFTVPAGLEVEYLIVGGGGGGGGARGTGTAAGGGAGGVLTGATSVVTGSYSIVVGAGGAGEPGAYEGAITGGRGDPGGNSSALGLTALGGGGGAYNNLTTGMNGGSGGGGAPSGGVGGSGTPGQGYAGGAPGAATNNATKLGGGGGGAGGVGGTPDGGVGIVSGISGTNVTYATGGKGGAYKVANTQAGAANTGDGGSGGSSDITRSGADGGSGIVIIRYEVVPAVDLAIVNTTVTNVQATAVDIKGELDAVSALVDVYAYWSTNNNADAAEWLADTSATNASIDTYRDVENQPLTNSLTGLLQGQTYYYTFMASNSLTNIWATPSKEFGTKGTPQASTAGGATNEAYGSVTLQGRLTAGGEANAYIVWGPEDGLTTSTGDWAHVESAGSQLQAEDFSLTVTGLLYGIDYKYRVYVTNEYGSGWSGLAAFTSTIPESAGVPLVDIQNTAASNITATTADIYGVLNSTQSVFTVTAYWSTTNHGSLAAWLADGSAGSAPVATYTNVTGQTVMSSVSGLTPGPTYYFTFVATNVATNIWASPNAAFTTESTPTVNMVCLTNVGIGSAEIVAELTAGGFANAWVLWDTQDSLTSSTGDWAHAALSGQVVESTAFTNVMTNLLYGLEYYSRIYVTNSIGDDWTTVTNFMTLQPSGLSISNRTVSNVGTNSATLRGTLNATQSVFSVYAFWSTNNNADASAWTNDSSKGSSVVGTYTNVVNELLELPVSGLDLVTTYYYTFMASNVIEELWASTNSSFSTVDTPAVTAVTATASGPDTAQLTGTLTQGYFADAWLVWDTTEQGTGGTQLWANVVSVGTVTQDLAFAQQATSLLYGPTYYSRFFVTNEAGSAWSGALTYTTDPPAAIAITNTSATNVNAVSADLLGSLDATQSVFTVTVYWSTNNNADGTAWLADATKTSVSAGIYTNVMGQSLSVSATGLTANTTYYYTFAATNDATNMWASPNASFNSTPPPQLDSVSPTNGSVEVALDVQLVASFDSVITLVNGGTVTITNITDGTSDVITLPDAQVTNSAGTNLVITPSADLAEGKTFAVLIASSTILSYAGISDTNTWSFITATPSTTPPELLTLSPTNGTTDVDPALVLNATFDKAVAANAGNIIITNVSGSGSITIPITNAQVTISGTNLTINPTAYLDRGTTYAVLIANDVIRDTFGNAFAGITNVSTWQFTTALASDSVVTIQNVYGHNEKNNFAGWILDLIIGSGMNGNDTTPNPWSLMDIIVPWPTNHPSAWTITSDSYTHEWSPKDILGTDEGDLDPDGVALGAGVPPANSKIGWVVFDLGSVESSLADLYIWNVRNTTDAYVESFNVYVADTPTASIVSGPTSTENYSRDYDFGSGGWTKVNTSVVTGGTYRGNQVVSLGGNSGRYVAIEIMTNGGNADRVGLAEVGITAYDNVRPTITNLAPAHLETEVLFNVNLVAQFDETIVTNAGNIVISNLTASTGTVLSIADSQVTVSGSTLTINLSADLDEDTTYSVRIDPGAVTDAAGNGFTGITDDNTWRFKTFVERGLFFRFK